jgi:hypothetical protein
MVDVANDMAQLYRKGVLCPEENANLHGHDWPQIVNSATSS